MPPPPPSLEHGNELRVVGSGLGLRSSVSAHHCRLWYTMSGEPTYSIVDVISPDVTCNDMHCRFLNGCIS